MAFIYVSLILPAITALFIGLSLTYIIHQIWIIDMIVLYCGGAVLIILAAWKTAQKLLDTYLYPMLIVDPAKKAVLITGCDTGFGNETASRLNSNGFRVYACCLFPNKDGAKKLKKTAKFPDNMVIMPLDVTKRENIDKVLHDVEEDLKTHGLELWCLVNNAGIARSGPLEFGDFDDHFRNVLQVNTLAVVEITRKFLPLLRQSKGRIVFLCSLTSRYVLPYSTAYSMSKHAVLALVNGLRWELRKFGVEVVSIEPNFAKTDMFRNILAVYGELEKSTPKEILDPYEKMKEEFINSQYVINNPIFDADNIRDKTIDTIVRSVNEKIVPFSRTIDPTFYKPINLLSRIVPEEWAFIAVLILFRFAGQDRKSISTLATGSKKNR
ncbi:17-beta-hydroxysteroid dehydrogenase type 6-like [Brevipalpus obovatus]|uniref:17-beta-hydroxysteroid dehydrogenase type 6-like n=1 Tax=Brevipalpus obovatus TaxID=246614 RepID=UPI003D9EBE3A